MGADQERGDAEQDGHRKGCSSATAEGDPGGDHRRHQCDVPDAYEDSEIAKEDVLCEVLGQVLTCRLIDSRLPVQVVNESADPDSLQRLEGAVEDDEWYERNPADPRRSPLNIAHEHINRSGKQRDEDQHPDVDHEESIHHVLQIQIDRVGLPAGMEEEEDRPRRWHAKDEGNFTAAQTLARHGRSPLYPRGLTTCQCEHMRLSLSRESGSPASSGAE